MSGFRFERLLDFLTSTELFLGLLWAGLAALSITLLVLLRTRWGQSQPLRKCLVLSLLAHLLLAGYATTVQIWSTGPRQSGEPTMRISLADAETPSDDSPIAPPRSRPWEEFLHDDVAEPRLAALSPAEPPPTPEPRRAETAMRKPPAEQTDLDDLDLSEPAEPDRPLMEPVEPHPALGRPAEGLEAPKAERREPAVLSVPATPPADRQPVATPSETPRRQPQESLPLALLSEPTPPPRVAEQSETSDSGELIRDVTDLPAPTPRSEPAEATAGPEVSPKEPLSTASDQSAATAPPAVGQQAPGAEANVEADSSLFTRSPQPKTSREVPETYRLRLAPDRLRQAQRQGATPESEAAVRHALQWLATNQEPDGRWNGRRHGAGREMYVAGEDRKNAGMRADTGVTGLALLALLAAGHTHQQGAYQDNVRRGLEFLLGSQQKDGNLSGEAATFAAMYCHAMATFALCEAYGMTGDGRLEPAVRRAIDYTVAAQDPRGGGWRYWPGSRGDTSQLGWQLMALRSAELAGIPTASSTRAGALRFLRSVSSGRHGGLAAYRAGERATRPMTAEALVCRQLLGMPPGSPTATEAADHLLSELPGEGPVNLYYWYYSTLGLYHAQGDHWRRWNQALQNDLVARQRDSGNMAGSWDPDSVWGNYGGRVYSTALATLCLEVYYRYLPRYLKTADNEKHVR